MYHALRRIKFKEDASCSEQEKAQKNSRTLYLLADNVAENKNNCLFAFCSELIARKWYDEIQLLFGPVGHTHNGNDAVHYIHNQIAGNYVSITPAELFNNYAFAWRDENKRPQPLIMETQYAWDHRYLPLQNRVSGFKNDGTKDPAYVRAFRFTLNATTGVSEMHIKGSPSSVVCRLGTLCQRRRRTLKSKRCISPALKATV